MEVKKLGKGTIDKGFYLASRAKIDLFSVIKGVQDKVTIEYPNGDVISLEAEEGDAFTYKHTRGSEEIRTFNFSVDKRVPLHPYQVLEALFKESCEAAAYDESTRLDLEGFARGLISQGIEYSSYNSDLYIPENEKTIKLVENYTFPNNVSKFKALETKDPLLEIPFGYDEEVFDKLKAEFSFTIPPMSHTLPKETDNAIIDGHAKL